MTLGKVEITEGTHLGQIGDIVEAVEMPYDGEIFIDVRFQDACEWFGLDEVRTWRTDEN